MESIGLYLAMSASETGDISSVNLSNACLASTRLVERTAMDNELLGPVQIFRTGTFPTTLGNEVERGPDKLDEIIRNFQASRDALPVPVVIGHSAPDSEPASGYIEKLRRVNDRLFAWLSHVPPSVVDA